MCDEDKGGAGILEWLLTSKVQQFAQQASGPSLVTFEDGSVGHILC